MSDNVSEKINLKSNSEELIIINSNDFPISSPLNKLLNNIIQTKYLTSSIRDFLISLQDKYIIRLAQIEAKLLKNEQFKFLVDIFGISKENAIRVSGIVIASLILYYANSLWSQHKRLITDIFALTSPLLPIFELVSSNIINKNNNNETENENEYFNNNNNKSNNSFNSINSNSKIYNNDIYNPNTNTIANTNTSINIKKNTNEKHNLISYYVKEYSESQKLKKWLIVYIFNVIFGITDEILENREKKFRNKEQIALFNTSTTTVTTVPYLLRNKSEKSNYRSVTTKTSFSTRFGKAFSSYMRNSLTFSWYWLFKLCFINWMCRQNGRDIIYSKVLMPAMKYYQNFSFKHIRNQTKASKTESTYVSEMEVTFENENDNDNEKENKRKIISSSVSSASSTTTPSSSPLIKNPYSQIVDQPPSHYPKAASNTRDQVSPIGHNYLASKPTKLYSNLNTNLNANRPISPVTTTTTTDNSPTSKLSSSSTLLTQQQQQQIQPKSSVSSLSQHYSIISKNNGRFSISGNSSVRRNSSSGLIRDTSSIDSVGSIGSVNSNSNSNSGSRSRYGGGDNISKKEINNNSGDGNEIARSNRSSSSLSSRNNGNNNSNNSSGAGGKTSTTVKYYFQESKYNHQGSHLTNESPTIY